MTEKEKILSALAQSNISHRIRANDKETSTGVDQGRLIRYKDGQEIFDKHPDCCRVIYYGRVDGKAMNGRDDSSFASDPLRRRGMYAGNVIVRYDIAYKDKSGQTKIAEAHMADIITNCGRYYEIH